MQLTGTHLLNAPVPTVWAMLMDTDTLTRVVPAVTNMDQSIGR